MKTKSKVDQINDAFISILAKENAKGYEKYIKAINREMIDNVESLDAAKVKSILQNAEMNVEDIALLFLIQNAILLIVGKRVSKKQKENLSGVILLLGMYSLKRPERFVKKLVKINKGVKLKPRELEAKAIIDKYRVDNKAMLNKAKKRIKIELDKSIKKSKISKRMIQDLKEGLAENKSAASIKRSMQRKYNKLSNIERTLDTELHSSAEAVREEYSMRVGMTRKTWKTQGDSRVRSTCFHDKVTNKEIHIDSEFRACGLTARYPGDNSLPPSDRIRCRCYLEYK